MTANPETIRIELTPEQKDKLKTALNRDVDALEFTAEELEQRIAPRITFN